MNNLNNRLKNTTLINKQQSKHQVKFKVENKMIKTENEKARDVFDVKRVKSEGGK